MQKHSGTITLLALSLCGFATTACGAAAEPVAVPGPTTTLTATATTTATATATVTATRTMKVTATVAAEPPTQDVTPATMASSSTGSSGSGSFDRAWARDIASDIIYDVRTVDHRLQDGIAVSSALYLLSDDYDRLTQPGVPPGSDPAKYLARLSTLNSFAEMAADEYYDHPIQGSARYAVVREQTGVLFTVLNGAMETDYRLP